jgi:hypothetical protein
MNAYRISDDIKGSRRPFFRDEYDEWIEFACSQRKDDELYESRYEKEQREFFEKMNEENENLVDLSNITMVD